MLELTRSQILAYRRRVGGLEERSPIDPESLERVATAGLQDSMPRAALLSIHARVEGAHPTTWDDPAFVQVWGPRYSTYVVAAPDVALFTLGRLPDAADARRLADEVATTLADLLDGSPMTDRDAANALGWNPGRFRYGAPTGRILIRWEGAGAPVIWTVDPPDVDPREARLELARRYLKIFGPATPRSFAKWAGLPGRSGNAVFGQLTDSLTPVRTPIGDAYILSISEDEMRSEPRPGPRARLLPSGDAYILLQGDDRALVVADPDQRAALWPSRVWPGAILVGEEVVGTWRRSGTKVVLDPWRPLTVEETADVEEEAVGLPIPGVEDGIDVSYAAAG